MTAATAQEPRVLLVTEDPCFIEEARAVLEVSGAKVISCLGPAHTDCNLYTKGSCPLAKRSVFALIDSPSGGEFRYHTTVIPAGVYAEGLQRNHRATYVVLCGAPVGESGPTGEVAFTQGRNEALFVLTRLLRFTRQRLEKDDDLRRL